MKRVLSTISAVVAIAGLELLLSGWAQARDLTVVGWGGQSQDALRAAFFEPFSTKTATPLIEDSWTGGIGILRTKVQGGNSNWDVVEVEADELAIGCEEGLYEQIDWQAMGGRESFIPGAAVTDCGVGLIAWSVVLAYNADRVVGQPQNWVDFWDVKRFPGKRALRRGPKYTLEFAIMADGVPLSDVYNVLRTPEGVDRAFKKLDELRPNLVWWTAGGQPSQLMASGEVNMVAVYATRMAVARKQLQQNFQTVWNGNVYAIDSLVVLKGSPNRDKAMEFVKFATQAESQQALPPLTYVGVTNKKAAENVDPALAPELSTYPANLSAGILLDVDFWADNLDSLTQRFDAWVGK